MGSRDGLQRPLARGARRLFLALLLLWLLSARAGLSGQAAGSAASAQKPELVLQTGHAHYVTALDVSPDGRFLVSGGEDKAVLLWDVRSRRLVRALGAHAREVTQVAFSAEGTLVASAAGSAVTMGQTYPSVVKVWKVETGELVAAIEQDVGRVAAIAFAGNALCIAWQPQFSKVTVTCIEPFTKRELRKPVEVTHDLEVTAAAFSSDARWLATAFGNVIKVSHAETGKERYRLPGHQGSVWSLAFSPDGRWLASASEDKTVKLWDPESGRELRTLTGHPEPLRRLRFSRAGDALASNDFRGNVLLWETATGKPLHRIPQVKTGQGPVGFSPDNRWVASGAFRTVRAWDVQTGQQKFELAGHVGWTDDAALSRDGSVLVSAHYDKSARVWDMRTGTLRHRLSGHGDVVASIAVSPDGHTVASVSYDQQIRVWDADTGRLLHQLSGHFVEGNVSHVGPTAFSPDGRLLATSGHRRLKLWDISTGRETVSLLTPPLPPHPTGAPQMNSIWDIAFSPDGRWLALGVGGMLSSEVRLIEVATGREAGSLPGRGPLMFSQDSRLLAFTKSADWLKDGPQEKALELWDVRALRRRGSVKLARTQSRETTGAAISPDLRFYAEGGAGNSVRLLDAATGAELHTFEGHTDWIKRIEFSADGRWLFTAGLDGTVRLWDVAERRAAAMFTGMNDRNDWVVVTPDGLFDGSSEGMAQLVAWRFGNETYPLEIFFNEYYRPGLLAEVLAGQHPKAPRGLEEVDRRQPQVTLTLAGGNEPAATARTVRLRLDVAEAPTERSRAGSGARDVRLFRNGSLVKLWRGDVLKDQSRVTLEVMVPVVAGANRFTAYAFNRDNIKSADAQLVVTGAEGLRRQGTAYVVAIGVNQYANKDYNLHYAVADAQVFAEELARQQTKLGKYGKVEIVSLLDKEATKANLLGALRRLAGEPLSAAPRTIPAALQKLQPAQPEDAVFLYYAGHGTAAGPRFYLIPHDLGYAGPREEIDEAGLKTLLAHSISDRDLESAFERINAGRIMLVIDACNSGQALEAEEKRRGPMNSRGLAQLAYEKGMYVLAAAQGYQAALEVSQLGHGYLTYALVEEGLKTPSADSSPKDGQVMMREWLDYATLRVPQMQQQGMQEARKLGRNVAFIEGEEQIDDPAKRSLQRPRVFYRREPESEPLVVAAVDH